MDSKKSFFDQSMDEIVFENRNKSYGAFALRENYQRHLLKALGLSVSIFVIGLYSPKLAKNLGLFSDKPEEILDTTSIVLSQPPSLKPDEPPPPPPPEPVEIVRPTERFLEILAVEKKDAVEPPPPTIEELQDKDIGNKKVEGTKTDDPDPIIEVITTGEKPDEKVYVEVDQEVEYIGGEDALTEFLSETLVYPEGPRSNEITGTTIVYFIVNIDGKVVDVRVQRSSGNSELDAEAVRVVKKTSGKFKPAKLDGKPVRKACKIPIEFNLEEEE